MCANMGFVDVSVCCRDFRPGFDLRLPHRSGVGRNLSTHAPSTYKIPATGDVPEHFKIALWPEPNREDNVFGSKAVGEPPLMLAISVYEALRDAVASVARTGECVVLEAPATAEHVLTALGDAER